MALTPAGRQFYQSNAQLMHQYAQSVRTARQVAEGKTGLLRIAYMVFAATELMPQALMQFRASHPLVETKLHYLQTQSQKIALARDEIDIGYMIGPFEHNDFHSRAIAHEPLFVVTPAQHPLLAHTRIPPGALRAHRFVLGDIETWEVYRWQLNELFSSAGIAPNVVLEVANSHALLGLVAAGHGITVYPESMIKTLGPQFGARPIAHPDFQTQTILVWKRLNRSTLVRHFVELAAPGRRPVQKKR